jgi:hypothetical protein
VNTQYVKRKEVALAIDKKIAALAVDTIIVGSVAYGPESVTSESDLDLLGICKFSSIDFEELYAQLGGTLDANAIQLARSGTINNLSIIVTIREIEVGLHLWDISAFNSVTHFVGNVFTFRSDQQDAAKTVLQARADIQVFKSLSGAEKIVNKLPRKVPGGTVLHFYPFIEDEGECYPNIQIYNLLLDPVILAEHKSYIETGIEEMKLMLKDKLLRIYGKTHSPQICLYVPLPEKIKKKIPADLKRRLEKFF